MYTITVNDWGEAITPCTAENKGAVIDIVFEIRDKHPGAILTVEHPDKSRETGIDLADNFTLFGIEFA